MIEIEARQLTIYETVIDKAISHRTEIPLNKSSCFPVEIEHKP